MELHVDFQHWWALLSTPGNTPTPGALGGATIICSLRDPRPPSHSWKGGDAPDKSWLSWLLLTKKWHCWSFLDGPMLSQHSWCSWCSGAPRSLSKVCWWTFTWIVHKVKGRRFHPFPSVLILLRDWAYLLHYSLCPGHLNHIYEY